MGLKEWAEKNKLGGEAQVAKAAKVAARKAEWDEKLDAGRATRAEAREALRDEQEAARASRVEARDSLSARVADRKAARGESFEGVTLKHGRIEYQGQGGPVAGATARVESAADVRRRVTATRVLAVGVFALAAKKQTGHVFLTVEGAGFEFVVEVPVKKEAEARAFAARINSAAKQG